MLAFKDFAPARTKAGWLRHRMQRLDEALAAANAWISAEGIVPLRVETVVLPEMWEDEEEGPSDPEIHTSTNTGLGWICWYQFFRVWYDPEAARRQP